MRLKFLLITLLFAFCLAGCATVPIRQALPTYALNGTTYLPLAELCQLRGISWNYDSISRTVTLQKDGHQVNLRIADTLVLVDNQPLHQKYPPDIYQGTVVVPYRFKEQVLDVLFKEAMPEVSTRGAIKNIRKIVLDAGHGGNDPGAIGRSGLREKDVNLDIAKRLARLLKEAGVEVVMTRSTDAFISLARRVEIANNAHADLFISVHSNANRVRGMNGFEVYYVSGSSDLKRALAAAQHYRLNLDSSCFGSTNLNLKAILWDMIYTANRAESVALAGTICRSIDRDLETKVNGTKTANFYVLKGAAMPAVLIEIGFVSNSQEERLLRNSYYRQQLAESIMRGVRNYAQEYLFAQVN